LECINKAALKKLSKLKAAFNATIAKAIENRAKTLKSKYKLNEIQNFYFYYGYYY